MIVAMQPESLVQLVGSGNTSTVEEEWLRLIESPTVAPSVLCDYHVVLAELSRLGKTEQAEALASTAIECLGERHSPHETLRVAGAFLLGVGESEELRSRVEQLYRSAYADREGLDPLIRESGLSGGRPVRRALRTLDVCLSTAEGGYLASRDEDVAARVEKIDLATWQFTINTGRETEGVDAVRLADRFEPASATDFRVLKYFHPKQLCELLNSEPLSIIIGLCRRDGGSIDSTKLESLLIPGVFSESEWDKWWSKTRTALRKCKNIKLEGRSPCFLTYVDEPADVSEGLTAEFARLREPVARLELVERYLRDCRSRGDAPSIDALRHCYEAYGEWARREEGKKAGSSILLWTVALKLAQYAGVEGGSGPLVDTLRGADDPAALFRRLDNDALIGLACDALVEARPNDWPEQLLALLPYLPSGMCDRVVSQLLEAGRSPDDVDAAIQCILASPVECFEALLWLWDGPQRSDEAAARVTPVTVLTRILRALDECRRGEGVPRELAKRISARARSVLSARKFERFHACLAELDRGMALALRVHINQLDNLGRAVHDDLLTHLSRAFPLRDAQPATPPWQREDILYVTESGLARKQQEIEHHVNVKMRENAKAIGAAAEHGDLSENSEYKFALEERDLLRARLAGMNIEVAAARVLTPADIPTDHVGVGSRVVFRRPDNGETYEMTFLGPWEADHSKGWFNYRAPLAQAILGKRMGDVIDFDHGEVNGRYEIAELHNALSEQAAASRKIAESSMADASTTTEYAPDSA